MLPLDRVCKQAAFALAYSHLPKFKIILEREKTKRPLKSLRPLMPRLNADR